eukprot:946459_1
MDAAGIDWGTDATVEKSSTNTQYMSPAALAKANKPMSIVAYEVEYTPHKPIMMGVMVFLNVAMFVLVCITAGMDGFDPKNHMIGPKKSILEALGASSSTRMKQGEYWRLLVAPFVHSGLIHLVITMMTMKSLAQAFEEFYGPFRFLIIYLLSCVCGTALSAIFLPGIISMGANCAIYGLVGAMIGDYVQNYKTIPPEARRKHVFKLTIYTLLGLAVGILIPQFDNFSQFGGFITGLLASLALSFRANKASQRGNKFMAALGGGLLVLWVILLSATVFGGFALGDWCTGCRHLNCAEFIWDCDQYYADRLTKQDMELHR